MVVVGEAVKVGDVALDIAVVHPVPVYHCIAYGMVPPDGLEVSVID